MGGIIKSGGDSLFFSLSFVSCEKTTRWWPGSEHPRQDKGIDPGVCIVTGGGGKDIEKCDGDGDRGRGWGEDGDDESMHDDEDEDEVLEKDNGWGQEEEEEEEQHPFRRTMLMSLICWIFSTGVWHAGPSPVNPSDTLFG